MAATLADTDPVVAALAHLRRPGSPTLTLLGGDPDRIRGDNVPPYSRLRLLPSSGDDLDLRWLTAPALTVEALGDLDGTPGPVALRRLLYTALADLAALPDLPTEPGLPVVTSVGVLGSGAWVPLPNLQPRWVATVMMHLHPGRS